MCNHVSVLVKVSIIIARNIRLQVISDSKINKSDISRFDIVVTVLR